MYIYVYKCNKYIFLIIFPTFVNYMHRWKFSNINFSKKKKNEKNYLDYFSNRNFNALKTIFLPKTFKAQYSLIKQNKKKLLRHDFFHSGYL